MKRLLIVPLVWLCAISPLVGRLAADLSKGRIVILGDSLAAGYGVEETEAFPALLQQKLEEAGLAFEIANAGVSGDTTAGGLRRINWLLKRDLTVLILELGGNEGLRGIAPSETKRNLIGIIQKTREKYPEVKILLAGMQMPQNMGEDYRAAFQTIFPELAKSLKVDLIPFLLEGIGADPEFNQPDLIHPNPEGHKMVAKTVWKSLEPLLRRGKE